MANSVQIFGGVCKHGLLTTGGMFIIDTGAGFICANGMSKEPGLYTAMFAFGSKGAPAELQSR